MISEKHSQAARINGARSRGPKTPRGKARASLNAMRHSLLSKTILLPGENIEAFRALFVAYAGRFGPLDDVEIGLIEVAAYWRLRRAFALEMRMFDSDMAARHSVSKPDRLGVSFGDLAATPKLGALHRYQTRLHLIHSRALRDLALLRDKLPSSSAEPNKPSSPLFSTKPSIRNPAKTQLPPPNPAPPRSNFPPPLDSGSVLSDPRHS
jgi:hypothetical protein